MRPISNPSQPQYLEKKGILTSRQAAINTSSESQNQNQQQVTYTSVSNQISSHTNQISSQANQASSHNIEPVIVNSFANQLVDRPATATFHQYASGAEPFSFSGHTTTAYTHHPEVRITYASNNQNNQQSGSTNSIPANQSSYNTQNYSQYINANMSQYGNNVSQYANNVSQYANNVSQYANNVSQYATNAASTANFVPPPPQTFLLNSSILPTSAIKKTTFIPHHIYNDIPVYQSQTKQYDYEQGGQEQVNQQDDQMEKLYSREYEHLHSEYKQQVAQRMRLEVQIRRLQGELGKNVQTSQGREVVKEVVKEVRSDKRSKIDQRALSRLLMQKYAPILDDALAQRKRQIQNRLQGLFSQYQNSMTSKLVTVTSTKTTSYQY